MRLSENRIIAWIVLVVCVVGSIFGLGGASLAREHREVTNVFYNGAPDRDAGHCMNVYLNSMFDDARTMALEVQLHLGAENAAAANIMDLVNDEGLEGDRNLSVHAGVYRSLRYEVVDELYNEMYRAELTDAQRKNFKIAYDEFQSTARMIEKDPYIEMAGDYNEAREQSFISKLAAGLHGAEPLTDTF